MLQYAVFVDAGYLFAAGSAALAGQKQPRDQIGLHASKAVHALKQFAQKRCANARLLRIYWYDGARFGGRLSADHEDIAAQEDVKLRMGIVNSGGQQKGVDSMIVTDLIELARNRAITDAILLSGDEDIRIGVQIAQSFGVRVHLLGIVPARGSQAATLRYEADTTDEWDGATIATLMACQLPLAPTPGGPGQGLPASTPDYQAITTAALASIQADPVLKGQLQGDLRRLPSDIDRVLLKHARQNVGGELSPDQCRDLRNLFRASIPQSAV